MTARVSSKSVDAPLRVLLVSTSFPRFSGDPSGAFVERLARSLGHRAILTVLIPAARTRVMADPSADYTLATFRYAPRPWQQLANEPGGIPVALRRNRWNLLLVPGFLLSLFFVVLCRSRHADMIHANWSAVGLVAGFAGYLTRTPVVTTLRGEDTQRIETSAFTRLVLRVTARLNRALATVSDAMGESLRAHLPAGLRARVQCIPNGVDEQFFAVPLATSNENVLRVVAIGSLIPRKAPLQLIDAVSDLPEGVTLDLIGDGPLRDALIARTSAQALAGRVRLPGPCEPRQIPELLARYDVLVLASLSEGRPNVVLEAMAAGRTVVASDLPGVRELIDPGRNGILVSPGSSAAIAAALQRLLEDPAARERLARQARARIRELGLTWPRCAERYLKLYRDVRETI